LLLLCSVILYCSDPASNDNNDNGDETTYTTTVSGKVTDKDTGLPIAFAAVGVADPDTGGVDSTLTDAGGNYSVTLTHDGSFTLEVVQAGYDPYSTTVNTTSGSISRNVQLNPSQ
jgi:hypothetical protein